MNGVAACVGRWPQATVIYHIGLGCGKLQKTSKNMVAAGGGRWRQVAAGWQIGACCCKMSKTSENLAAAGGGRLRRVGKWRTFVENSHKIRTRPGGRPGQADAGLVGLGY